jgi:hypothetical protein
VRVYAKDDDVFGDRIEFVRPVAAGIPALNSPALQRGHCYSEK